MVKLEDFQVSKSRSHVTVGLGKTPINPPRPRMRFEGPRIADNALKKVARNSD